MGFNVMKCESAYSEDLDWFFGIPEGMTLEEVQTKAAKVHKDLWAKWGRDSDKVEVQEFINAMTAEGFMEINFEPHPADFWDEVTELEED